MWFIHCFVVGMLLFLGTSRGARDNTTKLLTRRCKENERRALLDFKAQLTDEYGMLSSWDNNSNDEEECCNWRGIRCSNRTGHITVVNIPGRRYHLDRYINSRLGIQKVLRGQVSPSLIKLRHLKYLNLNYNDFYGKIPPQFGNLTNLRYLDLGNNGLIIENLDWLSNLHLLTHLDLSFVNLSSCTGWLNHIYKLSSLTHLHLNSCHLPDPPLLHLNNNISLNSLYVVNLSFNGLISPSSYTWLFNFTSSLVHISMPGNLFRGLIPEAFGCMVWLEYLNIAKCQLEGELPRSFRNLSRLHTLHLDYNNFSGPLIDFLHPLSTNLKVLRLDENKFFGSLPDFTRFPYLRELSIHNNQISGSFPKTLEQVLALVHLDLSGNQITGSFPNLTLLSSLEELTLYQNKLEGNIPEAYVSNLSKLRYLDLSLNSLVLNFSFNWAPPFQLDGILLRNCTLGPNFPNWIASQRNFTWIDISYAKISDTIPHWFWDHLQPKVTYLDMSNNNIQGILPDLSLKFYAANHVWFDMSSNHLSGLVPSLPINIVVLDLSQNMLSGTLSFLCATPYMILYNLDLSDNQLSGELPDCLMNVQRLETLNLGNNNLSGVVPTSIAYFNRLQALQLQDNNISGELPSSLKDCKDLILLDFSKNKLSGKVPTWIGINLTSLKVLSLHKNKFSGSLPLEICHLRKAQVLDFSLNNFSGTIPNCINNITSLVEKEIEATPLLNFSTRFVNYKYLAKAVVQWKGVASEYSNTLRFLKLIDLSGNRLVGKIPEEIASLKELISLNLSSNNLTGYITPKIGHMENLESLDLSINHLSGEIPSSLASLTLLSVLDLSNNRLQGGIPTSTQLQSFDPSKYAGNEQLCGLPLPNKCRGIDYVPARRNDENESNTEDDDKFPKLGLYASVVLGFATGFWGFICSIMLRRTRRHSYYRVLSNFTDWIYVRTILNIAKLQSKFYS